MSILTQQELNKIATENKAREASFAREKVAKAEAEKLRISRQGKPGYDVFGNPVKHDETSYIKGGAPPIKKTLANGYGSGVTSEEIRERMFSESQVGQTPDEIRQEATERFQGEIDTVDELFTGLVTEAREKGEVRLKESLGQTRSISAQRGILGTLRGFGKKQEVTEYETEKTQQEINLLEAERARQKAVILGNIKDQGDLRIKAQEEAQLAGKEAYATYLEGEEAQNAANANAVITGLLQQGLTFEDLDESEINQISENLGISAPQLQTIYRGKLAEAQTSENAAIQEILGEAIRAGADVTIQQAIVDAQSFEEALSAASPAIGELARQKLITEKSDRADSIIDRQIKRIDLKQKQAELELFNLYGGLSPTQYLEQIEKQQDDIKVEDEVIRQGLSDALLIDTSMTQIDSILNSTALDTVVGGTFLTRGIGRQKEGFFGKTASLVAKGLTVGTTAGLLDEVSGNADNVVALTQQILDQQFLDKLIDVKSKGATFGALSDNEGNALRNAANAIAGTAIKDKNDRVIGYDMSERVFKEQMGQIKTFMNLARQRATGEAFNSIEYDLLDSIFDEGAEFNPAY